MMSVITSERVILHSFVVYISGRIQNLRLTRAFQDTISETNTNEHHTTASPEVISFYHII